MTLDLDAIKGRLEAATPGPWEFVKHPESYGYSTLWNPDTRDEVLVTGGFNDGDSPVTWMGEELSDADKAVIEHAPTDIAALATEVERRGNLIREAAMHYALLGRMAQAPSIHQVIDGKRVRRAKKDVLVAECQAAMDRLNDALEQAP